MLALEITNAEVESRAMTPEHLSAAAQAIREDGFVILHNVVAQEHLDLLQAKMLADVELLLQRDDAPFNWNVGNIQQDPPPFPPYLFRDVLLNDMAVAVTKAVLGPGVKNGFYSGNTALPSTERQPVHVDTGQLWPNLETAHPPCQLVVNVPVVEMTPENGSTEIWPGTHRDTSVSIFDETIKVSEEKLNQRRAIAPPIQPHVKRGGIVIRDIRLWHAGMPNRTQQPRPMIATIHTIHWLSEGARLKFPKGTETFFQESDLTTLAEFVDGPIDYIRAPKAYDYQK